MGVFETETETEIEAETEEGGGSQKEGTDVGARGPRGWGGEGVSLTLRVQGSGLSSLSWVGILWSPAWAIPHHHWPETEGPGKSPGTGLPVKASVEPTRPPTDCTPLHIQQLLSHPALRKSQDLQAPGLLAPASRGQASPDCLTHRIQPRYLS